MTFKQTALEVVRDSIRSAICIDDEYGSAYTKPDSDLKIEEPSKLYYSFREKGHCDLDIYNFKNLDDSWNKEYMIENKDLMVLDWELDPGGQYNSTLKILTDVIQSKKIPFILIYTNTEDLDTVSKALLKKFCPYSKKLKDTVLKEIKAQFSYVSEGEFDLADAVETSQSLAFDIIHKYEHREKLTEEFVSNFNSKLSVKEEHQTKTLQKFEKLAFNKLGSTSGNEILNLNQLFYADDSEYFESDMERIKHKVPAYRINGTIVMIFHKGSREDGILPEELFNFFSDLLVTDPNNFLSILSLELKDSLRKEFSLIGSKFSSIEERSFLYHINNYRKPDGKLDINRIYDFILNSWISELYNQRINKQSEMLNYSDEFIRKFEETFKFDDSMLQGLLKYSLFTSTTELAVRADKSLRFGDTFGVKGQNELFFLCITPHCDLINPRAKVNDNIYFVKGTLQKDEEEALKDVDSDFYSFAQVDKGVIAIKWICKPVTFYLPDADISKLKISYSGKEYELNHLTLVKENITQRIANQSFGYGYRVGIDVPYIPKE